MKANRQQRRAQERAKHKVQVGMVRMHDLTFDEADLIAEALDAYVLAQEDLLGEPDATWTVQQAWARARAIQIRELLQAAVEGRPNHDGHADRLEPATG